MNIVEVTEVMVGKRVDKCLMEHLDVSRSKVQKLIDNELVLVNDNKVKCSYCLKADDKLDVLSETYEEQINIEAENIPLDIVFEDEHLLVINKASGMVVHPAVGNHSKTLVNALLYHFNSLAKEGTIRPGIVHRIDKDTSGLLIVCKTDLAFEKVSDMIRKHEIKREYVALVHGVILNETATIDAPIGRDTFDRKKMAVTSTNSKSSITHLTVLKRYENTTLIKCRLETGRTHQIRVHLKYIKYPIVNDLVYGRKKTLDNSYGQLLHACSLEFVHPITSEKLSFKAQLPDRFKELMNECNGVEEEYGI